MEKNDENDEMGGGTGILGDLVLSNADIAIGAITPRSDLHQLFDFTVKYMQVRIYVYIWFVHVVWVGLVDLQKQHYIFLFMWNKWG